MKIKDHLLSVEHNCDMPVVFWLTTLEGQGDKDGNSKGWVGLK
jgi:hypothetical protein